MADVAAIWKGISTLDGWTDEEKCATIVEQVEQGARTTVEVGVYGGRGLFSLALAHKVYGGVAYGVDPWDNAACLEGEHDTVNSEWWGAVDLRNIYQRFLEAITRFEVEKQTRWVKARSEDAVTFFGDGEIDFLIIDGNHSTEKAMTDIQLWHSKLRKGATLLLDDTDWLTVQPCLELLSELRYNLVKDTGKWRLYRRD